MPFFKHIFKRSPKGKKKKDDVDVHVDVDADSRVHRKPSVVTTVLAGICGSGGNRNKKKKSTKPSVEQSKAELPLVAVEDPVNSQQPTSVKVEHEVPQVAAPSTSESKVPKKRQSSKNTKDNSKRKRPKEPAPKTKCKSGKESDLLSEESRLKNLESYFSTDDSPALKIALSTVTEEDLKSVRFNNAQAIVLPGLSVINGGALAEMSSRPRGEICLICEDEAINEIRACENGHYFCALCLQNRWFLRGQPWSVPQYCPHCRVPSIRIRMPMTLTSKPNKFYLLLTYNVRLSSSELPRNEISKYQEECALCMKNIKYSVAVDCGHRFCVMCLFERFDGLRDHLNPPYHCLCCKSYQPIKKIKENFTLDEHRDGQRFLVQISQYNNKIVEIEERIRRRLRLEDIEMLQKKIDEILDVQNKSEMIVENSVCVQDDPQVEPMSRTALKIELEKIFNTSQRKKFGIKTPEQQEVKSDDEEEEEHEDIEGESPEARKQRQLIEELAQFLNTSKPIANNTKPQATNSIGDLMSLDWRPITAASLVADDLDSINQSELVAFKRNVFCNLKKGHLFTVKASCRHKFCVKCFEKYWIEFNCSNDIKCPVCRESIQFLLPFYSLNEINHNDHSALLIYERIKKFNESKPLSKTDQATVQKWQKRENIHKEREQTANSWNPVENRCFVCHKQIRFKVVLECGHECCGICIASCIKYVKSNCPACKRTIEKIRIFKWSQEDIHAVDYAISKEFIKDANLILEKRRRC